MWFPRVTANRLKRRINLFWVAGSLALLLQVMGSTPATAQDKAAQRDLDKQLRKTKPARQMSQSLITPSREAAALAFVGEHHAELATVLRQLKEMSPQRYEEAILDLFKTSEKMAELQSRDKERYTQTLEAWKLQSRIDLLSARLTQKTSPALLEDLEKLLEEQVELRVRQQVFERDRLKQRLDKMDSQINRLKADRKKHVSAQMRRWVVKEKGAAKSPAKQREKSR